MRANVEQCSIGAILVHLFVISISASFTLGFSLRAIQSGVQIKRKLSNLVHWLGQSQPSQAINKMMLNVLTSHIQNLVIFL
jgi:hypothetical protein